METVVSEAPAPPPRRAPPKSGGKTGTTTEEPTPGSAAGVGAEVTACVWVGYPDTTTPMLTYYTAAR